MPGTYTSITLPPLSQLLPQLLPHPLSLSYSPIHIYMSPDYPSPRIWHDVPFMPGTLITPLLSYSPIHIYVPEPYRRSAIYMSPDYPPIASSMTCSLCQVFTSTSVAHQSVYMYPPHFYLLLTFTYLSLIRPPSCMYVPLYIYALSSNPTSLSKLS